MEYIAIDSGNTNSKAAYFKNEQIDYFYKQEEIDLIRLVNQFPNAQVLVSTVNKPFLDLLNLAENRDRIKFLNYNFKFPFEIDYQNIETLGSDRISSVSGAYSKIGKQNFLVIDCGTCITYNIHLRDEGFIGGMISPGIDMRFKALHTLTARLPLVTNRIPNPTFIGKSTIDSITTGVIKGAIHEMNGIIDSYNKIFPEIKIILCGGDALFFESNLKQTIFAEPNLVLIGLHEILRYNQPNY